jgi:glucose/arabinose dehydrogenase
MGRLRARTLRAPLLAATLALLAAACGPGSTPASTPTGPPWTNAPTGSPSASAPTVTPSSVGPSPAPTPRLAEVRIRLERIAVLDQPVAMAVRAGDPALYVAEKPGRVVALAPGRGPTVVLDLSGRVSTGSEQGLLGLALSPDGRYLYVDLTDPAGDTRVLEYRLTRDGIDPASEREVLRVDQPYANHNGGQLAFGPDGHLYIGLGDGGSAGDPEGRAQSLATLLGKILRISPRPVGGRPYGVPSDNPFVDTPGARPEIWAYGLRNPWRFSFDRATGELWIGDVGQSAWEEVDVLAPDQGGANLGWDLLEGSHPFEGSAEGTRTVLPVYEYPHDGAVCAVTGGFVYRGEAVPALQGAYVFGDFCTGVLQALAPRPGRAPAHRELGPVVPSLASFGEDAAGELYALSLEGAVYRLVPG